MGCPPPPPRPPLPSGAEFADTLLRDHAAHFGRLLESAYGAGDRDLALICQQAMFDVVKLRRARRFGMDTPAGGDDQ